MKRCAVLVLVVLMASLGLSSPAFAQTQEIDELGRGTTEQTTPDGCQAGGQCTDTIEGRVAGDPITNRDSEGEDAGITGSLTADYSTPVIDETAGTFAVPVEGDVTLRDDDGSTILLSVLGTYTGALGGNTARLTGTFEVQGGTGRFEGATGSGEIEGDVTDNGETGTFVASLLGELVLPEPEPEPEPPAKAKKNKKDRKDCPEKPTTARKNCQQNKNGNGNG